MNIRDRYKINLFGHRRKESGAINWKSPVRALSDSNITLSGEQTIDGVSIVAGNLVGVFGQTTSTENGVYVASASGWERDFQWKEGTAVANYTFFVEEGTVYADTQQQITNNDGSDILGTDTIVAASSGGGGLGSEVDVKNIYLGSEITEHVSTFENIIIGYDIGFSGTRYEKNTIIGNGAANSLDDNSDSNVIIGYQAGASSTPNGCVAIGAGAGIGRNADVTVGYTAGAGLTVTSEYNTAVGYGAFGISAGSNNGIAVGFYAGANSDSSYSTFIGSTAGQNNDGDRVVAVGASAGNTGNGNNTIFLGNYAGYYSTESDIFLLGNQQFTNAAEEKTNSLLYGVMGATPSVQSLTVNGDLTVSSDAINVETSKTPSSATDTGTAGDICWDADYIYVCTATDVWKRSSISTWT